MIHNFHHVLDNLKLAGVISAPLVFGVLMVESVAVSDEHIKFVGLLVAVVVTVVGVVAWINSQIQKQISAHTLDDKARHRRVLLEIRHMRELFHLKFGMPLPEVMPGDEDPKDDT